MDNIKINQLKELFTEWFNESDFEDKHLWCGDKFGILLKEKLVKIDRWRNRTRGDAVKGRKKVLDNIEAKEKERKEKEEMARLMAW